MKINYKLNSDNTIKNWQAVPFDETKAHVEIVDNDDVIIAVDKVINGQFSKGDRAGHIAEIEAQKALHERIIELKSTLTAYTEDFAQAVAGLVVPNLDERKKRFIEAHNELRQLEGKAPRGLL